jgi:hypothetical protein
MAVNCVLTAISFHDSSQLLSYEQYPHLQISHAGNTPEAGSWCSAHGAVVECFVVRLVLRSTIGRRIFAAVAVRGFLTESTGKQAYVRLCTDASLSET